MRCLNRDLAGGRLPKDGHLLADLELRTIIEAYAEDQAIFFAVGACLFSLGLVWVWVGLCSRVLPLFPELERGCLVFAVGVCPSLWDSAENASRRLIKHPQSGRHAPSAFGAFASRAAVQALPAAAGRTPNQAVHLLPAQDYAVAHEALSLLGTKLPPSRVAAAQAAAAQEAAAGQQLQLTPTAQVRIQHTRLYMPFTRLCSSANAATCLLLPNAQLGLHAPDTPLLQELQPMYFPRQRMPCVRMHVPEPVLTFCRLRWRSGQWCLEWWSSGVGTGGGAGAWGQQRPEPMCSTSDVISL